VEISRSPAHELSSVAGRRAVSDLDIKRRTPVRPLDARTHRCRAASKKLVTSKTLEIILGEYKFGIVYSKYGNVIPGSAV
jgi:hypothetical protein